MQEQTAVDWYTYKPPPESVHITSETQNHMFCFLNVHAATAFPVNELFTNNTVPAST